MSDKMREAVVTLEEGKYTFLLDAKGVLACHRYGEPWRDFTGDKAIYALFDAYREATRHSSSETAALLTCAAGWLAAPEGESRESTVELITGLVRALKRSNAEDPPVTHKEKVDRIVEIIETAGWRATGDAKGLEQLRAVIHRLTLELSSEFVLISVEDALPPYEEEVLTTDGTYFTVAERVATTKAGEVWKLCGENGDDEEARTIVTVKRWCRLPSLSKEGHNNHA